MSQDDLKTNDIYKIDSKSLTMDKPLRMWKIWWWDVDDKKHILYTKQIDEQNVVDYCKNLGLTKFTIYNDKFKNVNNDGKSVTR
jgi:hypothetical protein